MRPLPLLALAALLVLAEAAVDGGVLLQLQDTRHQQGARSLRRRERDEGKAAADAEFTESVHLTKGNEGQSRTWDDGDFSTTILENMNHMEAWPKKDPGADSVDEERAKVFAKNEREDASEQAEKKKNEEGRKKALAEYQQNKKQEQTEKDNAAKAQEREEKARKEAEAESQRKAEASQAAKVQEHKDKDVAAEKSQKLAAERRLKQCSVYTRRIADKRSPSANAGQFRYPAVQEYPYGWSFSGAWAFDARATLVGDFNGDGKTDFVRLGATYFHFFIAKGDGTFWRKWYYIPSGWNFGWDENVWTSLPAMDLDGDGKADIVRTFHTYNHAFLSRGSNEQCFTGDGPMALNCFQITAFQYPAGWVFAGVWNWPSRATIVGDFNGDQRQDFARLGATYIHLFISQGNGQFWTPVYRFPAGWNFGWDENAWTSFALDTNGDCATDILRTSKTYNHVFTSSGNAGCFNRNGDIPADCFQVTTYQYPFNWVFEGEFAWNHPASIIGDFNGDGKQDYARLGRMQIRFFISKGNGQYFAPVYSFPAGWDFTNNEAVWTTVNRGGAGDFDGDGRVDVIRTTGRYLYAMFPRGDDQKCWNRDGNIPADCMLIKQYWYPNGWDFVGGWTWNSLATHIGDWNGDGKDDFINLRGNRYHHIFLAE